MDLFDPAQIHSTGIQVPEGPRLEEVFLMCGLIAETGRLRSMDVVEFNPSIGTQKELKASLELILDLVELGLGHLRPKAVANQIIFAPEDLNEMDY